MPGFDGTGPWGLGPMTGRGEGHCAIVLPPPGTRRSPYRYAGLAGTPVQMRYPYRTLAVAATAFAPFSSTRFGRALGRRPGPGGGRWR